MFASDLLSKYGAGYFQYFERAVDSDQLHILEELVVLELHSLLMNHGNLKLFRRFEVIKFHQRLEIYDSSAVSRAIIYFTVFS